MTTDSTTVDKALVRKLAKLKPEQRERLVRLTTPRIVEPYIAHIPHPKQQVFLTLQCREAMYGGAAGGGKSDAVLMSALQYVDVPGYSALILRRTWPDLNSPGAILDRARTWLGGTDARQKDGGRLWIFPSGAKLSFGYLQHDKDKYKFQSAEYQFIGFDELTHFEEAPYLYMFSRLRRPDLVCLNCQRPVRKQPASGGYAHTQRDNPCNDMFPDPKVIEQYGPAEDGTTVFDVPLRMRSATNPGGIGNEWVKERFVDPTTAEKNARFIPARLKDNPSLDRQSYEESLSHLSIVDRERLKNGDWDVTESGEMFQRTWFKVIPAEALNRSEKCDLVRFWDMAATDGGGDWTVGTLVARMYDGTWQIRDQVRGQWSGAKQERIIQQTAMVDGPYVPIRMEQEPGSSGKNIISHYARNVLQGYNFDGDRPTGDKTTRAYNAAVAAEKGLVSLIPNEHTRMFLNEAEAFPGGGHDDMVDSFTGGFNYLAFAKKGRLLV